MIINHKVYLPSNFLLLIAYFIKSKVPTIREPTGEHSPFDKQNMIESAY